MLCNEGSPLSTISAPYIPPHSSIGYLPGATTLVSSVHSASNIEADYTTKFSTDVYVDDEFDVFIGDDIEGINARIERIESLLGISPRSRALEAKYDWLKDIGDDYDTVISEMAGIVSAALSNITDKYVDAVKECSTMEKLKINND